MFTSLQGYPHIQSGKHIVSFVYRYLEYRCRWYSFVCAWLVSFSSPIIENLQQESSKLPTITEQIQYVRRRGL